MSILENKVKKQAHRVRIQQQLMLALFRITTPSSLAFAPDSVLLRKLDPESVYKGNPTQRMWQALSRLESRGLLKRVNSSGKRKITLTASGKKFAERLNRMEKLLIPKPKKWDGKWRIVIFDIWERRRKVRNQLRSMLVKAGFKLLQDSVWIHPYDCEDLLVFLRADLRLGNGVLYIIAEGIENDTKLRSHFDLH